MLSDSQPWMHCIVAVRVAALELFAEHRDVPDTFADAVRGRVTISDDDGIRTVVQCWAVSMLQDVLTGTLDPLDWHTTMTRLLREDFANRWYPACTLDAFQEYVMLPCLVRCLSRRNWPCMTVEAPGLVHWLNGMCHAMSPDAYVEAMACAPDVVIKCLPTQLTTCDTLLDVEDWLVHLWEHVGDKHTLAAVLFRFALTEHPHDLGYEAVRVIVRQGLASHMAHMQGSAHRVLLILTQTDESPDGTYGSLMELTMAASPIMQLKVHDILTHGPGAGLSCNAGNDPFRTRLAALLNKHAPHLLLPSPDDTMAAPHMVGRDGLPHKAHRRWGVLNRAARELSLAQAAVSSSSSS